MEHYAIALIALAAMEIVLGIDNIVFIAILTDRLPVEQRSRARKLGLSIALVARIMLLCGISWVMSLTAPFFSWTDLGVPQEWFESGLHAPAAPAAERHDAATTPVDNHALPESESTGSDVPAGGSPNVEGAGRSHSATASTAHDEAVAEAINVSGRDLILLLGGLFLIFKTVKEIHAQMEGQHDQHGNPATATFSSVLIQIGLLDIVFSLDSVITAVGMVDELWVMIVAVIIAVGVMVLFANQVSEFVSRHPTLKMLALSFLMLIGVMLVAEGLGTRVEKGYIYFAMAFSLGVEMLNMRVRTGADALQTRVSETNAE